MSRLFAVMVLILSSSTVSASITATYTSRSDFDAAVGATSSEDFNSPTIAGSFADTTLDLGFFSLLRTGGTGGISQITSGGTLSIDGTKYATVFTGLGRDLIITFDSAISAFGIDTNNFNDNQQRTLVEAGGESVDVPIGDGGIGFSGFSSDTAFTEVRFIGIAGVNDGWAFDNLAYAVADDGTVPEPASLAVWSGIAAFAVFGVWRKRRGV